MRRSFLGWRAVVAAGLVVLLALAGTAWFKRVPLLTWYSVRGLVRAADNDRDRWIERLAQLDGAAVPPLIACLHDQDAHACANAGAALSYLVHRWGPTDDRTTSLALSLADVFATLSVPGQQSVLDLQTEWLQSTQGPPPAPLVQNATQLLAQSAHAADSGVHFRALVLAQLMLTKDRQKEVLDACRQMAGACLHDEPAENRALAVKLALLPAVHLLEQVVPLLNDPAPEVRRAAMLAVGPASSLVATEDLLQWLHDPDPDVQRLCEEALRSRGLRDEHLRLGRLKSDSNPRVRLQVLEYLPDAPDLDPGVWLRNLSHDAAPAVRAAVIRAASEQTTFDLTDRIEQMSQDDPCPTVRQVAVNYLNYQKSHRLSSQ